VTTTTRKKLADNLSSVRQRIAAACARVKRTPDEVRLIAVTKSASLGAIKDLVSLGQEDLAESRVQQMTQRAEELEAWRSKLEPAPTVRWHMVGTLQRNKVKACIAVASTIHSVDSLRLAEEISLRAQRDNRPVDCLLEVNCSEETQKSGVAVGAAMHLAEQISTLKSLRLLGLMTMAPLVAKPEDARLTFVRLREIFEEICNERLGGRDFVHLSMGMSQDFEVAIEEGATMVRIGTALFE
jgi:PLP dependent protein